MEYVMRLSLQVLVSLLYDLLAAAPRENSKHCDWDMLSLPNNELSNYHLDEIVKTSTTGWAKNNMNIYC